jgi:putative transposase
VWGVAMRFCVPQNEFWGMILWRSPLRYFHIWFQTKRKAKTLLGEIDDEIHKLFFEIAKEKRHNLMAFETMIDHAHMLLELSENDDLSIAVKTFKGISARRIFQSYPALRFQIRSNNFWARKFDAREVSPENLQTVIRYICDQKKGFEEI